jgi:alkanesulfonate monooxygenase SsuD/methylene tetrahydromethanopterin reductase-like flavin-dependent oxidoreductase (luciferase family)
MTRYLDPVLLWTVAATATSRVRLNASTLSTFYYEPTHLARMLTTLDVLSDGRLDVGVGVGWMKDEHDIARGADLRRRGRMRRVGRIGTGWLGVEGLQDSSDHLSSIARRAAQDAGRDPDALKSAMRINLEPGTPVDSVVDKLERFSGDDVDEAIVDAFALLPSLEQLLDFASQVITKWSNRRTA